VYFPTCLLIGSAIHFELSRAPLGSIGGGQRQNIIILTASCRDQKNWRPIDLILFDCLFLHSRGVNSAVSELKDSIIYAIEIVDDYAMFAERRLMTPQCSLLGIGSF
jgi:hypothetical protein